MLTEPLKCHLMTVFESMTSFLLRGWAGCRLSGGLSSPSLRPLRFATNLETISSPRQHTGKEMNGAGAGMVSAPSMWGRRLLPLSHCEWLLITKRHWSEGFDSGRGAGLSPFLFPHPPCLCYSLFSSTPTWRYLGSTAHQLRTHSLTRAHRHTPTRQHLTLVSPH